jgi:uncharacterized protein (DUF342 family)
MAKVTKVIEESRNGGCPAIHHVDGEIKLATGETVPSGMVLLQGYELDDPATAAQIRFDPGENVLAMQESLILAYADKIRAGR